VIHVMRLQFKAVSAPRPGPAVPCRAAGADKFMLIEEGLTFGELQ